MDRKYFKVYKLLIKLKTFGLLNRNETKKERESLKVLKLN